MIKTNWDLTQIFNSNEDFEKSFLKSQELCDELAQMKGKIKNGEKEAVLKCFKLNDAFESLFEKVYIYARCKSDEDGKDDLNNRNYMSVNNFYASSLEKLAFIPCELSALDEQFLTELNNDADFVDYTRTIQEIIESKKHTPSELEEQLLSSVSGFSNYHDMFSTLTEIEMTFGEVEDDDGNKVRLTPANYNLLLRSKKQEVRQNVMKTYLSEFKKFNQTIANLYISNIKYKSLVSKVGKYNSVLHKDSFESEITENIMLKNIEYVSKNSGLMRKFFDLKKKILGLDEFYTSDMNATYTEVFKLDKNLNSTTELKTENDSENTDEKFDKIEKDKDVSVELVKSLLSCVEDIKNSYAPLGKDYQDMFEKALSDGWIDFFAKPSKAGGGYTISTFLIHPYILLNYDGTDYWKSAITHEFGHAMHSHYSNLAQPYAKSGYTLFIAEVASLTNEVLLTKYLLSKETNKNKKIEILSNFLSLFYLNVFSTGILAEFEHVSHEKIWNNETMTAKDFTDLYKSICERYYGDSVKLTENFEYDWERRSHIFRDYYLYKYSTGLVSACAIASKIISDTTGEYVKKYKEFLSIGNSKSPLESLKVAEIDITKEETYNYAFSIFEEYLNEMKKLYEEK